jgi:putative copper resistance protein D
MLEFLTPVVRGLVLLALLLLLGLGVAAHLVARADIEDDLASAAAVRGWMTRLPGLLAWFLLMLSLARGALQVLAFSDPGAPIDPELARAVLLEGSWGTGWLVLTAGAFLLLAISWLLMARPAMQRRVVVGAALVLAWAQAGMGHGADEALWSAGLGRAVHLGHLVGGGLWLGTLAILALAVLPTLRTPERLPLLARVVKQFSVPARAGAALLVVSGAVATWTYTGPLLELPGTLWGRLLLLKLGLLGGVAALGWHNWKRITPALEAGEAGAPARLRRAVLAELLLGLLLLAATAVLVGTGLPVDQG